MAKMSPSTSLGCYRTKNKIEAKLLKEIFKAMPEITDKDIKNESRREISEEFSWLKALELEMDPINLGMLRSGELISRGENQGSADAD